ncbi:hypothetical protein APHAL10511_002922 [Amanita phalloides]|nr:hypothetical protein APHAL10511_002922 [Amanita phalloides]
MKMLAQHERVVKVLDWAPPSYVGIAAPDGASAGYDDAACVESNGEEGEQQHGMPLPNSMPNMCRHLAARFDHNEIIEAVLLNVIFLFIGGLSIFQGEFWTTFKTSEIPTLGFSIEEEHTGLG